MNTLHHHDQRQTFETESLQADVMRFMAIIAFCLIAIMMLVKELPEATTSPDIPAEVSAPESVAPLIPERVEPPAIEASLPRVMPVEPIHQPQPEVAVVEVSPLQESQVPAPAQPEPVTGPASPAPLPETSTAAIQSPLMLQFASDRAFMRLLTNNRIQLYARKSAEINGKIRGEFHQMTPSFEVVPAEVHGELYEVMGSSLPGGVLQLFDQADLFLIRLPHATRAELMDLHQAHQSSGGRLLITGDGGVIYEERQS